MKDRLAKLRKIAEREMGIDVRYTFWQVTGGGQLLCEYDKAALSGPHPEDWHPSPEAAIDAKYEELFGDDV